MPSLKRRTFLHALFALPAFALVRPKAQATEPPRGIVYTDSDGNTNLAVLGDDDLSTGITYGA